MCVCLLHMYIQAFKCDCSWQHPHDSQCIKAESESESEKEWKRCGNSKTWFGYIQFGTMMLFSHNITILFQVECISKQNTLTHMRRKCKCIWQAQWMNKKTTSTAANSDREWKDGGGGYHVQNVYTEKCFVLNVIEFEMKGTKRNWMAEATGLSIITDFYSNVSHFKFIDCILGIK